AICDPDIGPGIAGCGPGGVPSGGGYVPGLYPAPAVAARPSCIPPMLGARAAASGGGVSAIGRCELGLPGGGRGGTVVGRDSSRDGDRAGAGAGGAGDEDSISPKIS